MRNSRFLHSPRFLWLFFPGEGCGCVDRVWEAIPLILNQLDNESIIQQRREFYWADRNVRGIESDRESPLTGWPVAPGD